MKSLLLFCITLLPFFAFTQLRVDIYPTEEFMIKNMLIGNSSVKVWNVEFVGSHDARGVFYNENTPLTLQEGIILSTGEAIGSQGRNKSRSFTGKNMVLGDKDLSDLAQRNTYDATYISFEFEAKFDYVKFDYVFASDEYPEYVGSAFNDVFGFFLTDLETGNTKNLAVIPNSNEPITVNNINHKKHANFYISNTNARGSKIEYDGLTQTLIAYSKVVPNRKYSIKIAIADVADDAYDSAVFLKGKSFISQSEEEFYAQNSIYFAAIENDQISADSIRTIPIKTTELSNKKLPPDSIIILFGFDESYPLTESMNEAELALDQVDFSNYKTRIIGHTDVHGDYDYNVELSHARAQFVKNWMEGVYEIKDQEILYKSFNQLVSNTSTEKGDARNRRVVIYFLEKDKN